MRTLSSDIQTLSHSSTERGKWVYLVEAVIHASFTRYLTPHDKPIHYNETDYDPFPILVPDIEEISEPQISTFEIAVSNVDKSIAIELENGNITGNDIKLIYGFLDFDSEVFTAAYDSTFQVINASFTPDRSAAIFVVGKFNLFEVKLPRNRWIDIRCGFSYRGLKQCHYGREEFKGTSQIDLQVGGDGSKLNGWTYLNSVQASVADINVTNEDELFVQLPDAGVPTWSTTPITGPFLYKSYDPDADGMDMDFDLELEMFQVTGRDSAVGIVICEDSDTPNDYVGIMVWGGATVLDRSISVRQMNSGTLTETFYTPDAGDYKRVRVTKSTDTFFFWGRDPVSDEWVFLTNFTKTGFTTSITRVGVGIERRDTQTTSPSYRVEYIYLTKGGFTDCLRSIADCKQRDNFRRFGAAPGILHGPLQL